ncbi:MAG TPA: peptide chain release factor N(5)-glutamine methyltransferase [Dermatophilaceae bacterium]|nr:peptide chain release factor N(5)-glutamine methyltransferase [Dermatophilaceae bacterium]
MTSLRQAVDRATTDLARAGVDSPRSDAVTLAAFSLGVDRGEAQRLMALGVTEPEGYAHIVSERARRVPLQHLTGSAGFRRLRLCVGPGVFVPRPETELTAGLVVEYLRGWSDPTGNDADPLVVDLGCGSGAIALAVKDEVERARVVAVELSPLALAWAERNVATLGLDVELRQGDLRTALTELDGTADVVVSNPPYIPPGAGPNQPEVRLHDPELALFGGGADGLALPAAVLAAAQRLLRPGGALVVEHADSQGDTLTAMARRGPWDEVADRRDNLGRPRVLVARRR